MAAPLAFGAVEPWAWAALLVAAAIVAVLWVSISSARACLRVRISPAFLPVVAGIALIAWQLLTGRTADFVGSRESLIKLAGYGLLMFLSMQVVGSRRIFLAPGTGGRTVADQDSGIGHAARGIGIAVTIYVFAIAVFAIIQFFSSPGLLYWTIKPRSGGYIFGPYVNHNHYAGLLELVLPLAIGTVLGLPAGHGFRPLGVFAIAMGVVSVLLCGSRGGTIAVALEMTIFLLLMLRPAAPLAARRPIGEASRLETYRKGWSGSLTAIAKNAALATVGLAILALTTFAWLDDGTVWNRWATVTRTPELAAGTRKTIAVDGLRMWREHPFVGVGAGAFGNLYPQYQSWVTDLDAQHAHNDYVEILAETGVVGALLALAFVVILLRRSFARLWRYDTTIQGMEGRQVEWLKAGAAIACCGLMVHSLSDFNLHIPANAAWFAFVAALCLLQDEGSGSGTKRSAAKRA